MLVTMSHTGSSFQIYLWSVWLIFVGLITWTRASPTMSPALHTIATVIQSQTPLQHASEFNQSGLVYQEPSGHKLGDHRSMQNTHGEEPSDLSWHRRRRRFAQGDRESLPGQDPRCDGFIHSVELVQPHDPSVMTDFFGVSTSSQKRVKEFQFQTPNWPNPFPYEIDCIKIISAPTKHHRILLNFRGVFELEPEPNCLGDFLEVRDGAFGFSPLLGRFCSRRVPNVGNGIQTTGQYMWLRFRSDSTIPHRGFQAVYRFYETSFDGPSDHVFRFRHRMDMQAGETWKLDQNFLLGNLHDYSQDLRHLPIEAAFDVRAPNGTNIVIFVNRIKVPQAFSWTCNPEQLLAENPRFRCLKKSPLLFGPKSEGRSNSDTNLRLNKIALQDPSSIIDGRHTRFEVYDRWSISAYSPPCPKVRQFCDETVGLPGLEKAQEWQRNFHFKHSRAVIRILLPSILEEPPKINLTRRRRALDTRTEPQKSMLGRQAALPYLEQMPEFDFQITIVKRTLSTRSSRCEENWIPCDSDTCIPQSFWCDKIVNCPQKQDEGQHCTAMTDQGKSSYELRKEKEAKEAATTRLAAQKLHLSILGTLGLILIIVTITCVVMAIRRRKREQFRSQAGKSNEHSLPPIVGTKETKPARFNRILATGTLMDKSAMVNRKRDGGAANSHGRPIFTLAKSNSIPEQDTRDETRLLDQADTVADTGWNSTDSVNAPLLWHKHASGVKHHGNHHAQKHQQLTSQWSPDVPAGELLQDRMADHMANRDGGTPRSIRSPLKPSGKVGLHARASTVVPVTGSSPAHLVRPVSSVFTGSAGAASLGTQIGTSAWNRTGTGRTAVSSSYQFKGTDTPRKIAVSSRDTGQWTGGVQRPIKSHHIESVGPLRSDATLLSRKPRSVWADAQWHHQTSADQPHLPSCRLISRTQSWGGGLRLAGTEPFCNGQWEVTHETDSYEPPDLLIPPTTESVFPKQPSGSSPFRSVDSGRTRQVVPVYRCQEAVSPGLGQVTHRAGIHVSMPNVNGIFPRTSTTTQEESPIVRLTTVHTKRDFKPPSAKRPRISPSQPEPRDAGQWIASNYGTDTDEDFSAGTIMLDECASVHSDNMHQAKGSWSNGAPNTTGRAAVVESTGLRSFKPDPNPRMMPQPITPFADSVSPRRTAYSPDGTLRPGPTGSVRISSASEASIDEGSVEHSQEYTNDQSGSEDMYNISKAPSYNDYSSDSEASSLPRVLHSINSDQPIDSTMPVQFRPVVRRLGVGPYPDTADLKVYRSGADAGRQTDRGSRMTAGPTVDPVEPAYIYEYEA